MINVEEEDPALREQVRKTEETIRRLQTEKARYTREIETSVNVHENVKSVINYEVQNTTLRSKIEDLKRAIAQEENQTLRVGYN